MGSSYVYFLSIWCLLWLVDHPVLLIVFPSPKDAFSCSFQQEIFWRSRLFREFCFTVISSWPVCASKAIYHEFPMRYLEWFGVSCSLFNFADFPFNFFFFQFPHLAPFPFLEFNRWVIDFFIFPLPLEICMFGGMFCFVFVYYTYISSIIPHSNLRISSRHYSFMWVRNTCYGCSHLSYLEILSLPIFPHCVYLDTHLANSYSLILLLVLLL